MKLTKESLTPLMKQYHLIKKDYQEEILFFRLGDFYEMFGEDAIKASPILEVVLTKRQNIPMCGVPCHSANTYISKLLKRGLKVAICEQMEEPTPGKRIIRREVVRLITPGTLLEENLLDTKKNNFLLCLFCENNTHFGLAYTDISTGDFYATEYTDDERLTKTAVEFNRINPAEVVLPERLKQSSNIIKIFPKNIPVNFVDDWNFSSEIAKEKLAQAFKVDILRTFHLDDKGYMISACSGLLSYLEKTQKITGKILLKPLLYYSLDEFMFLDDTAIRNLELVEGIFTHTKENSLLEVLDYTVTSMGARLLRQWLIKPLTNVNNIQNRLSMVRLFVNEGLLRRSLRDMFKSISDLERIISRLSSGIATPRDLIMLKESLKVIPKIKAAYVNELVEIDLLKSKLSNLPDVSNIVELISQAITDEPPIDIRKGNVIKQGYNPQLDELRNISHQSKHTLSQIEQRERQRTGINSLKVGYTSVFGYYIEVTKANLHLVPPHYIRRQTLANAERFTTPELKEYEDKILAAEEKITHLEEELLLELRKTILNYTEQLHIIANTIAELDVYLSFAECAIKNNYCEPVIDTQYTIEIEAGRHPVVEKKLSGKAFVPNDTYLDGLENQIIILTGPNMAGKSTYLRQVALITILSQIGSFVPAKKAHIGIVDRIFTRIGATDSLSTGESTFMIEMRETADILYNSTSRSLVILDEVGRGTSTYDGISIAWATVEYLVRKDKVTPSSPGPKVLFATHFFELTELADIFPGIKNFNVSIHEWKDKIIFLYKIVPGSSDRSYGIHVAKLAGLPDKVITRATELLSELEKKGYTTKPFQLDLFKI